MRNVGLTLLASVAVLLAGAACGLEPPEEIAFPAADFVLGAEDSGSLVELGKGQTLKVSLRADSSTGSVWEPRGLDESILRRAGTHYSESSTDLLVYRASSGTQTLLFEAVDIGQTSLTLVYQGPREEDSDPGNSYAVDVVVR